MGSSPQMKIQVSSPHEPKEMRGLTMRKISGCGGGSRKKSSDVASPIRAGLALFGRCHFLVLPIGELHGIQRLRWHGDQPMTFHRALPLSWIWALSIVVVWTLVAAHLAQPLWAQQ